VHRLQHRDRPVRDPILGEDRLHLLGKFRRSRVPFRARGIGLCAAARFLETAFSPERKFLLDRINLLRPALPAEYIDLILRQPQRGIGQHSGYPCAGFGSGRVKRARGDLGIEPSRFGKKAIDVSPERGVISARSGNSKQQQAGRQR
jgi:hypothetical protein